MPLFQPEYMVRRITDLTPEFLKARGIRAVLLDVDNTLAAHNNPSPAEGVAQWLERLRQAGMGSVILSNNYKARVEPFARKLGLDYIAMAWKPLTTGLTRACKKYGFSPRQVALVGDQIFTDMVSGNLKGVHTILVEPFQPEKGGFFRLKRRMERPLLRRFSKQCREVNHL